MNMNVKLDGEEEQSVHFPNRATIALQSGPAAYINLNIVNPNMSNPGYILNPVTQVPQNFVAYQSPVTLQSYITLQEADGNIVNNLQVGVPVPIGLPVPAELLHNPNLVNTSIIIGNEECNQPVIFKPATTNVPDGNDIKFGYVPKPVAQDVKSAPLAEDANLRLSEMTGVNMENVLKKPCPLEMSIKAANIDLEFEKCDPEDLIPEANGLLHSSGFPLMQKMTGQAIIPDSVMVNVPAKLEPIKAVAGAPVAGAGSEEVKKPKTEITWEDGGLQGQSKANEFQESLICEVEEANEDEDECSDDKDETSSSDENETLPLSVVLKLRRVQEDEAEGGNGKCRKTKDAKDAGRTSKRSPRDSDQLDHDSDSKKFLKVRHCCSKKECFKKITLKDQRMAHKNFYDLESTAKQDAYLMNCIEHVQANRSGAGDPGRGGPCDGDGIVEPDDKTLLEAANIQMEIENESNGNQMLSDEIQQAIKESLKDCMANQMKKAEDGVGRETDEDSDSSDCDGDDKTQNWNYYIVIDRCRKKVCLQFLLKLFRITKTRVKKLHGKILSGQPLSDDSSSFTGGEKMSDVWDFVKVHLDCLPGEGRPNCRANPRHRYLNGDMSVESLFNKFKDFYREKTGKEVKLKIYSYKRFLKNDCNISLSRCRPDSCSECNSTEEQGRKNKKRDKASAAESSIAKLDRSFQARKKGRKKWEISTDSEWSSDDEPLAKRKKLRLTISLKGNKVQNADRSDPSEAERRAKKKTGRDARGRGNAVKGRDVWSLMLLHLETMPYKVCKNCVSRKRHRFFDTSMTKQTLYEDYRRYFLKETNSELGLGFTMYEKYFDRNCGYTIGEVDVNCPVCPRCALEPPKPDAGKSAKKNSKNYNNNIRSTRQEELMSS